MWQRDCLLRRPPRSFSSPARTSETIRTVEESFHRADYRTEETVAGVTEAADDAAMPVTVTINAAEFLGLTEPAGTEELSPRR